MTDVQELQKRLDEIKSQIEDIELQMQNTPNENNDLLAKKLDALKDEQVTITAQLENQLGLSDTLGDIHRG